MKTLPQCWRQTKKLDYRDRVSVYCIWGRKMISLKMNVEIDETRKLKIDLPESINTGKHEMILIIAESVERQTKNRDINEFSGTIKWDIDGLELQKKLRDEWQ